MTDAEWWAQVRRQRDRGQHTAGPSQLALRRMAKGRHVAEAVIWRVSGIGLELRYALDGELRSSQVHRDTGELAAAAEAKRDEMIERGWPTA